MSIMSEEDPISINYVSLELTLKDSLKAESGSTASEISEDEVQDARKKNFEDASEKLMSPLGTLGTCHENKHSSFANGSKETNEELLSQGETVQACRMLDLPKEGREKEKDPSQKASWKLFTEQVMLVKEPAVADTSDVRTQEEKLVVMRESLLDCIVRESPIKEVSSFLTQPTGASSKTTMCFSGEDLFVKQDGPDAIEKNASHEGNKVDIGQHTQPTTKDFQDNGIPFSPDLLDENLDYIRTQMQSNRHLKERLKSNLAHCISKKKVTDSTSPPESIEIVSKGKRSIEENSLYLPSEKPFTMAEECRQGDMGDRGIFPSHTTRRCLSPYESSLKRSERGTLEFCSKQLRLQEGDMDFNRAISIMEQDQMKQCTHFMDLQYNNIFLEKKVKEMEKKLLQEGDLGLNKVIKGLVQDQKKQQTQIMDLYYDNVSLKTKIKQLETDLVKQNSGADPIKQLERNAADLLEAKNKSVEEKEEAERGLKSLNGVLANPTDHLRDFGTEGSTLLLQLEKLKADCEVLQEKHHAEVEEKTKYMNQCAERDCLLHRKEQEIHDLNHLKQKLEHEASDTLAALLKMKEAKEDAEKHLASLQAELQRQKDERLTEREEVGSRYSKLVAQIKTLQVESETEQVETEKMQQQVYAFRMENGELQQQIGKCKLQNHFLQQEAARWKQQYDQIRESQSVKEQMQFQMIQVLRHKIGLQQKELRKKENIIEWKMHILGRFLLDMKSMHSDLSFRSLHTDEDHFNAPYVQKASNLLSKIRSLVALTEGLLTCQDTDHRRLAECSKKRETVIELKKKMKNLSLKKKTVEKEDTEPGPEESEDLPNLLRTKLDEYHKQSHELHIAIKELEGNLTSKEEACKKVTGENDKLQHDLGNLTCKVKSYEEIIECADERLEIASSEIS